MSSEWPLRALGELTVNHDGRRRPVKESERKAGPYPYYGASGVVDHVDGYLFDGEYLLVGEDGENLRTRQTPIAFLAKSKFWVNNHAHIVAGNELATTRYLLYALLGSDISSYLTGAVMPKLTQGNLNRILLPCPPRQTQEAIVSVLGMLDDRIALLRETNATLEAIAQALFKSWFVDFDPVRAKSQGLPPAGMDEATAALFPDGFQESALGPLPMTWATSKLGDETAYLNRGISPKYLETGGVQVLNQKCVRDFAVDQAKARRHDTSQRSIAGRELHVGDVLVNSTGVGTLGRVAQVLALNETTIVDSHVTVVRAGRRLTWNYLGLALMRRQSEIEGLGEGSTGQTELSRGKLAQLEFIVPPETVLRAFDAVTVPLRSKMSANSQRAQTLATLRDTLLPRLISGQLRLPEAVAEVENIA